MGDHLRNVLKNIYTPKLHTKCSGLVTLYYRGCSMTPLELFRPKNAVTYIEKKNTLLPVSVALFDTCASLTHRVRLQNI